MADKIDSVIYSLGHEGWVGANFAFQLSNGSLSTLSFFLPLTISKNTLLFLLLISFLFFWCFFTIMAARRISSLLSRSLASSHPLLSKGNTIIQTPSFLFFFLFLRSKLFLSSLFFHQSSCLYSFLWICFVLIHPSFDLCYFYIHDDWKFLISDLPCGFEDFYKW